MSMYLFTCRYVLEFVIIHLVGVLCAASTNSLLLIEKIYLMAFGHHLALIYKMHTFVGV